jgi:hypothetical protein
MTAGYAKVWTGSAWVEKPAKVWSGSAWVQKPVKFWDGSTWRTTGPAAPAGPTASILTSYAPPTPDRDDFSGEVGVRINTKIAQTYSFIGMLCHPGNSGLHHVALYEWFSGAVVRSVDFDVTGKAPGTWLWVPITPFPATANGYIALLKTVAASSGQPWYNEGATAFNPTYTGDIYATYKSPGGPLSVSSPNAQYIGVDLGW